MEVIFPVFQKGEGTVPGVGEGYILCLPVREQFLVTVSIRISEGGRKHLC